MLVKKNIKFITKKEEAKKHPKLIKKKKKHPKAFEMKKYL